jgi:hypothetical protein
MKHQTSATLLAAFAKVKRAETYIRDLHAKIDAFYKAHPYEVLSEINAEGTEEVYYFRVGTEFPEELCVDIGTILHTLRSPLDQAACAIALITDSTPEGVMFPFSATPEKFEKALRKQKKLPTDAKDLIRATKPYKGGNALLWALHALNIGDKHHPPLVPAFLKGGMKFYGLAAWAPDGMSEIDALGPVVLIIGNRNGQHLHAKGYVPTPRPPRPSNEYEFLTAVPGTRLHASVEPSFGVTFRDIEGFERQPVVAVLHQMRQLVEGILLTFEKRFFPS